MNIVRNFGLVTALSLALLLLGGGVVSAQSTSTNQTVEELQSQIEQLEQQVESLRAQIDAQEEEMEDEDESEDEEESEGDNEEDNEESATSSDERASLPPQAAAQASIARQLGMGDRGPDVKRLQELLATNSEIYPEGLTTGYFGPLTSQAVTRLQERIGLNADGEVGSTTLSEINTLLTESVGQSGMIPPGLLKAPGLWKKAGESDDTGTSSSATSTEDESEDDEDADDEEGEAEEDEESAESESDESSGMPDWDRLPIDGELKNRMKSMFGGQGGNPGQGGGR